MADASFSAHTLDDLLRDVFTGVLERGELVSATKGDSLEVFGAMLELTNPKARLSRTETRGRAFSCLGELCWYLAKSDELPFIYHYVPAYEEFAVYNRLEGAYGPRLFAWGDINQFQNIVRRLTAKASSRQAVIQLFDRTDLVWQQLDTPCTCTLQFMIRNEKLNLLVSMRSNDVYIGLPHDVFCFTMLQEILARTLDVELGVYKQAVGSLHLYDKNRDHAVQFLGEGFQSTTVSMPQMPEGDPWPEINRLLRCEAVLRVGGDLPVEAGAALPYWRDLIRLLQVFQLRNQNDEAGIKSLREELNHDIYRPYVDKVLADLRRKFQAQSS